MTQFASARFWEHYHRLPEDIRALADKQFPLVKANPSHPSVHFKKVGKYWSARVNVNAVMRALAVESKGGFRLVLDRRSPRV